MSEKNNWRKEQWGGITISYTRQTNKPSLFQLQPVHYVSIPVTNNISFKKHEVTDTQATYKRKQNPQIVSSLPVTVCKRFTVQRMLAYGTNGNRVSFASANQRPTLKQCWYKKRTSTCWKLLGTPKTRHSEAEKKLAELLLCGFAVFLSAFFFFIKDYKVIQRWRKKNAVVNRTAHRARG